MQFAKSAVAHLESRVRQHFVYHAWIRSAYTLLIQNNQTGIKSFCPPSRSEVRAIKRYAREQLGSSRFAPGLIFYTTLRGEFHSGWLTPDFLGLQLLPAVSPTYRNFSNAKSLTNKLLRTSHIPDIGYTVKSRLFDREWRPVDPDKTRNFFGERAEVVFKSDGSWKGSGVRLIRTDKLTASELKSFEDGVFQEPIKQNKWLEEFYPDAVNTLRIITTLTNDKPAQFRSAYLRLGYGCERVVGGRQIVTPVVDESGSIADFAFDENWRYVERHPDTGRRFDGSRIPNFEDAIAVCRELHQRVPHLGFIGWDVTIDVMGRVVLLEWNANSPTIIFPEATVGPSFRDLVEAYRP